MPQPGKWIKVPNSHAGLLSGTPILIAKYKINDCLQKCQFSGISSEPSTGSTRIVFFTMFTTSLIVFILYSASLTSFVACHKTVMPFEDSHSLYYSTDIKVATVKGVSYLSTLEVGNEVERKIFHDRMLIVSRSTH